MTSRNDGNDRIHDHDLCRCLSPLTRINTQIWTSFIVWNLYFSFFSALLSLPLHPSDLRSEGPHRKQLQHSLIFAFVCASQINLRLSARPADRPPVQVGWNKESFVNIILYIYICMHWKIIYCKDINSYLCSYASFYVSVQVCLKSHFKS